MIPGSFWHVTTKTVMQMSQWHSSQLGAQRQIDKHDKNWQEINMMKHDDKNWQEFWRDQFGSNFVFLDPNDPNDPNSISFDIVRYRLPSLHLCPSSCCGTGISGLPMGFLAFGSWLGHVVYTLCWDTAAWATVGNRTHQNTSSTSSIFFFFLDFF